MTLQGGAAATCPYCGARLIFRGQTTCQACDRDLTAKGGGPDVLPSSALAGVKITLPAESEPASSSSAPIKPGSQPAGKKSTPSEPVVEGTAGDETGEPEEEPAEETEEPEGLEEPEEEPRRKSRGGFFGLFRRRDEEEEPEDAEDEAGETAEDESDEAGEEAPEKLDLDAEIAKQAEEIQNADATTLYGPHGDDVASLLDALNDMDDETAGQIADAYEAIPSAEHKVAQSIVRRLRHDSGMDYELSAAEQAVSDWFTGLEFSDEEQDIADTYAVVADAASDAVAGLVLEDELNDVDFATLYGPWSEVMDTDEGAEENEEPGAPETGVSDANDVVDAVYSTEGEPEPAASTAEAEPAIQEGEFGPNTELVDQLLATLPDVSLEQLEKVIAAWRNQPKEEMRLAHRRLQAIVDEDRKWHDQLHSAQDEVFAWIDGAQHQRDTVEATEAEQDYARAREIAGPAVADAVAALALADLLDAEDAEILYAPWAEAIGRPELPQYEEDEEAGDGSEDVGESDDDEDDAGR